jgi:hypothetical protein
MTCTHLALSPVLHYQNCTRENQEAMSHATHQFEIACSRLRDLFQETPPLFTVQDITAVGGSAVPSSDAKPLQRNIFYSTLAKMQAPSEYRRTGYSPHTASRMIVMSL